MKEDPDPPKRREKEVTRLKNLVNILMSEIEDLRSEVQEIKRNRKVY